MRLYYFSVLLLLLLGCDKEEKETTTRGNLHVFIPESIAPVMLDEVNEFLNLYQPYGAHISYTVVSSQIARYHFVQDTSRIAFLPFPLTQKEKEQVKKASQVFNELIIAYDGIVVVVHPTNRMTQITTTELQKILTGTITRWDQSVNAKPMKGTIKVYCQDSSDVTDYLSKRFSLTSGISVRFARTVSDLQTLAFVEKDPLSIGFATLSWVDSAKSKAKVLNLGRTGEDKDTTYEMPAEAIGGFFSPHPANIHRGYYPLKRPLYMYTRTHVDLAAGFGTYVATAEGQKLFLKRGLLPGTQRIKLKQPQP